MKKANRAWLRVSAVTLLFLLAYSFVPPGLAGEVPSVPADWQAFEHCGLAFSLPPGWELDAEFFGLRTGGVNRAGGGAKANIFMSRLVGVGTWTEKSEEEYRQEKSYGSVYSGVQIESYVTDPIGGWKAIRVILTAQEPDHEDNRYFLCETSVAVGDNLVTVLLTCSVQAREEYEGIFAQIIGSIHDPQGAVPQVAAPQGAKTGKFTKMMPAGQAKQDPVNEDVPATLTPADIIGVWRMTSMTIKKIMDTSALDPRLQAIWGVPVDPAEFGVDMRMKFGADNTVRQYTPEVEAVGTWAIKGSQVIYSAEDGIDYILTLEGGNLVCEDLGDAAAVFGREGPAATAVPKADAAVLERGMALWEAEDYDGMLAFFDAAIAENSGVAEYYAQRGAALSALFRYEEAERAYAKAAQIEPENAGYWDKVGMAMVFNGKYQEAYEAIDKAVALEPSNGEFLGDRGFMLYFMERYEEALADLELAIEQAPEYINSYYFGAIIQNELGAYEEVVRYCSGFLARYPYDDLMWLMLGDAQFALGYYSDAISAYDGLIISNENYTREDIANYGAALELAAGAEGLLPAPTPVPANLLTFGSFMGEEIEWRELAKEDDRTLVIAEKMLDVRLYNEELTPVTWETCTLRAWLNHDFVGEAFTEAERARILETTAETPGENNTRDRIFLLSTEEANLYFEGDEDRVATLAAAYENQHERWPWDTYSWWLRSPGNISGRIAVVYYDGHIFRNGYDVNGGYVGVRPAMWLGNAGSLGDAVPEEAPKAEPPFPPGPFAQNAETGEILYMGMRKSEAEAIAGAPVEKNRLGRERFDYESISLAYRDDLLVYISIEMDETQWAANGVVLSGMTIEQAFEALGLAFDGEKQSIYDIAYFEDGSQRRMQPGDLSFRGCLWVLSFSGPHTVGRIVMGDTQYLKTLQ